MEKLGEPVFANLPPESTHNVATSYTAAIEALLTEEFPIDQAEVEAKITGFIPEWLNGALYRNGPGTFKNLRHLFDGYACLSKARCKDGRVFVSKRQVQSKAWVGYAKDAQPKFGEFASHVSLFQSMKSLFWGLLGLGPLITDNASVNIVEIPAQSTRAIALTETVSGIYEFDLETLETVRHVQYSDQIPGILTTAHPVVMTDGTIVNLTSTPGGQYQVYRQKPGAAVREKLASVPMRRSVPCWIHDIPGTENYIILPETPCFMNMKAVGLGYPADFGVMDWDSEADVLLHVVPLTGEGPIRTFRAPSYFTFHYLNAFEEGGKIHMDASHHKDPEMLVYYYLKDMRAGKRQITSAPVRRVTIDLAKPNEMATVTDLMKDVDQYRQCEFPSVHPGLKGKDYRYAYGAGARPPYTYTNALAKFDVTTGEVQVWHEPGALPSEPIMVPRQSANSSAPPAEDDGVVLSMVTDSYAKCFLLVLDASSFEELGRAWLPFNLAHQFHGRFITADK